MKAVLLCWLILLAITSFAQPGIYYADGSTYKGNHHTLEGITHDLDSHGRVYHFSPFVANGDDVTTVGFLLFTDSALWVFTDNPEVIDSAINRFDLQKFYNSVEFRIELEAFIAEGHLTEQFILSTLGEPEKKRKFVSKEGVFYRWYYPTTGYDLIFQEGRVSHYLKSGEF